MFPDAENLPRSVGYVRSKRRYPTVLQNLRLFRWMLDCGWMDYLRLIFGMWSLKYYDHRAIPKQKLNRQRETVRAKRHPHTNRHRSAVAMEGTVDQLSNVDYVTTNANFSQGESELYIFEGNEAVIKKKDDEGQKSNVETRINNTELLLIGSLKNKFGIQDATQVC